LVGGIEVNFPALFMEYARFGVECFLVSAYPVDSILFTKARAHAAIHNSLVSVSVSSACGHVLLSGLIGPDGQQLAQIDTEAGVVIAEIDTDLPDFDVARNNARPWRRLAGTGEIYTNRRVHDPCSRDRTGL
jgi:hypothetical protein